MGRKVLIVGGVAGGASAAARLRRVDETAEIILFERGEYISFANCGLPYYIGGVIEERSALLVQTPQAMKARFEMDVRVQQEVIAINKEEKKVTVRKNTTGETYEESYDNLILSPGSTPLKPPIPGIDAPNIFTLWNIPDTDAVKNYVTEKRPRRAAIIGGGFIGIEMAENFRDLKLEVSLVEMLDQVMAPIDFEMAQQVHQHVKAKGVRLYLSDGVKSFEYNNGVTLITLQSGKQIEADVVMLSIGIKPNSQLAKDAGLAVNERGGIVVDEHLKTSDPSIYAVGDAIEVEDRVLGGKTMIPLAGPANKQGRIAANNICGANETYKGTQGTSIAKVFDLTVAATGLNEKTLKRLGKELGRDYQVSMIHVKSHAGYYPGAIPMTIKLIFGMDGKILGAQIVGYDGADKRIDVIATALRMGGTVQDLTELELAYAPPYSSAKDPVNMAGFTAENILDGKTGVIHWHQMKDLDLGVYQIVDVREPVERELGFINGSVNIPVNQLRKRMGELDRTKKTVIYCAVGLRGYIAARILKQHGFEEVFNLSGGYTTYSTVFCQDDSKQCGGVSGDSGTAYKESGDVESEEVVPAGGETFKLNCSGLQCPGPIMQVSLRMKDLKPGEKLDILATDPGFASDIGVWAERTGNVLLDSGKVDKGFRALLQKGVVKHAANMPKTGGDDKTMIVFSGDLDKAIATFIIANGAASMGRKVTLFFTFWGLNILRRPEPVAVKKNLISAMFGMMMPRGSKKLGLSQMNMGGMGAAMIRGLMKKHGVDSLEQMIEMAKANGVRLVACNMSMDLMGITQQELIDGVELGGVATMLGSAEESDMSLFI